MSRHPGASRAARRSTLLVAAIGAAGAIAIPYAARPLDLVTAAPAPSAAEEIPTIIVTGARPGMPGLAATSAAVEPAAQEQPATPDYREIVRQVFGTPSTTESARGPIAAAYASLRSDGLQQVMIRDTGTHGPGGTAAAASVGERVHSLTAHTASAYGPEAVSGVLDVIVNRHADGIRISGSYGFYSHESAAPVSHAHQQPAVAPTFADRLGSTLQLLATMPAERPAG